MAESESKIVRTLTAVASNEEIELAVNGMMERLFPELKPTEEDLKYMEERLRKAKEEDRKEKAERLRKAGQV